MARVRLLLVGSAVVAFVAFPQLESRAGDGREKTLRAVREARRMLARERWTTMPRALGQSFHPCEGGPGFTFVGPR
ncbi:hypothetical protein BH23GEM2_BH23GEM2_18140 [soil metagenome]